MIIGLSACSGGSSSEALPSLASPPASFQSFADPEDGFDIGYPSDWEQKSGVAGSTVAFVSPSSGLGDQFRENVNVVIEHVDSATTEAAYTRANRNNLDLLVTDFSLIREGSTMLANSAAHEIMYTGSQGQYHLKFLQAWTVRGTRAYVLTYTAQPDEFDRFERAALQIFGSFGFA